MTRRGFVKYGLSLAPFILIAFLILEFSTGHSKFFDACIPPRKVACQGARLYDVDLANTDLTEANFSEANLTKVDFSGANLTRANLTRFNLNISNFNGANLTDVDLTGTSFAGGSFEGVILRDAKLNDANLTGVDFSGADLTGADLTGADLTNVVLDKTIWIDGSVRTGVMPASKSAPLEVDSTLDSQRCDAVNNAIINIIDYYSSGNYHSQSQLENNVRTISSFLREIGFGWEANAVDNASSLGDVLFISQNIVMQNC
jgi:hypothetical protein